MTTAHIVTLLSTGVGVGFASGLLGVGGAFIMTPIQYMVYTNMGIPVDIAIKLAFGTSLMVILPTAASGAWRHHKEGVVRWKTALIMGGSGLATAFGGATLATHLPGATLKIIFGIVVLAAGVRMLISRTVQTGDKPESRPWLWAAYGIPVGFISGLTGLGGGVLAVPILTELLRLKMHQAIATSMVIVMITSIGGIIRYILGGLDVPGLPEYSIGYVHLLSWVLLAGTSIGMAQVGARTAYRLPARQLRYIFIGVMFYMGLRMFGVFD